MDYESFKACSKVNVALKELLTSRPVQKKAKSVFSKEIAEDEKRLLLASKEGNVEEVARLLSGGMVDVNCSGGKYLATPMCEAAYHGKLEVLRILMDHGAERDRVDRHGQTPLHRYITTRSHATSDLSFVPTSTGQRSGVTRTRCCS